MLMCTTVVEKLAKPGIEMLPPVKQEKDVRDKETCQLFQTVFACSSTPPSLSLTLAVLEHAVIFGKGRSALLGK